MEYVVEIVVAVQFLTLVSLVLYLMKVKRQGSNYEKKYSVIIDIDKEVEKSKVEITRIDKEIDALRESYQKEKKAELDKLESEKLKLNNEIDSLRKSYSEKKEIFEKLIKEAAIYDEEIQLAELGFYKSHFDFDTSEKYKEKISKVKSNQKRLISAKKAIFCTTEWTVGGSKTKGKTFSNRAVRLTARAFNNECESAISNVAWNNADRMEMRIQKAFDAINKMNESSSIVISSNYLSLKMDELRLTHEYRDKRQQEKEEQAEIKRQMREEAQLERELEKANKEEEKYEKLLNKAKLEAEKCTGDKLNKINEQMEMLKVELEEAHKKSERAKSMAQRTKSGHVYVISNVGSFGENIYKIGMTRRLEPQDRVKELGDASVPFVFDVHAMIYSDDAPALENSLHKAFGDKRINLVNNRKEFFNIDLSDISSHVRDISPDAEFLETAEAREFRESCSIRSQRKEAVASGVLRYSLPESI